MQNDRKGVISMFATGNQHNKKNDDACQSLINLSSSAVHAKANVNKSFFINALIHENDNDNENQLLRMPNNSCVALV